MRRAAKVVSSPEAVGSSARWREGIVRIDGQRVGILEETEHVAATAFATTFTYDRKWLARRDAVPVSFTLPLREEPFVSKGLHPFFENLLPEGWLLEIATAKLKIPKDDAFGLLLALGADCIGAVEVVPEEPVGGKH